jgi:photosystem II stability/assembly factor-like uncharacterized protein
MGNLMSSLRRILGAAILTAIAGAILHTSWGATWSQINTGLPGSNLNVNTLIVDPASPSTIYAQTSGGTLGIAASSALFKSTDAGTTWSMISSILTVLSLVIDPKNSSTLYAGTDQGIVKSTNGGVDWTDASSGLPKGTVNRLVVDPFTPSTLYAVIYTGSTPFSPTFTPPAFLIYKTTNGGTSWKALDTGLPQGATINVLVIDPATPSTLYVLVPPFFSGPPVNGAPPRGAILKSTDGGESWTMLDPGLSPGPPAAFFTSLVIDNSSALYAVLPSFGGPVAATSIMKSTDGGETWKTLPPLPANTAVGSLVLNPANPSTFYAVGSSFTPPGPPIWRLLQSTDAGGHWNTYDVGLPANTMMTTVAPDPVTGGVYVGYAATFIPSPIVVPVLVPPNGSGGVIKSTDGLQSFHEASAGLVSFDIRTLAMNPAVPSNLYAGGAGGVFRSTDGGATWNATSVTDYTGALVIDILNPNLIYAQTGRINGCNSDEHLLLGSPDGGVSWTNSVSPQNSGCILSATVPSLHAAPMVTGPADSRILYLAESDDQDGYTALLKSTDGGANWTTVWDWFMGLRVSIRSLAIDPAHPATLYAGVDDGSAALAVAQLGQGSTGLFKSTDGGATWTNTGFTRSAVNLLAIDPSNPNTIYASTEGHYGDSKGFQGLFKSLDGGGKWQAINNRLESVIGSRLITSTALKIDPANPNVLYLGTVNSGVFRSVDGGATWSAFNDGLSNLQIRALTIGRGSARTVFAATSGGVFKVVDQ